GRTRVTPRHRVVPHRAAAPLQKATEHRIAAVVEIDERYQLPHRLAIERLRIHAQEPHGVGAAREQIALCLRVKQIERPTLADHRIEIEPLLEAFPQPQRELVEANIVGMEIVRADDRGIAADIAESYRALLQYR